MAKNKWLSEFTLVSSPPTTVGGKQNFWKFPVGGTEVSMGAKTWVRKGKSDFSVGGTNPLGHCEHATIRTLWYHIWTSQEEGVCFICSIQHSTYFPTAPCGESTCSIDLPLGNLHYEHTHFCYIFQQWSHIAIFGHLRVIRERRASCWY